MSGLTIPARLAQPVKIAKTHAEARIRVINAYRHWYRSAPEICALYALNVSPSTIRLKVREDFERLRNVTDLKVINALLHKNWVEYQETMNCWKQEVSGRDEERGRAMSVSTGLMMLCVRASTATGSGTTMAESRSWERAVRGEEVRRQEGAGSGRCPRRNEAEVCDGQRRRRSAEDGRTAPDSRWKKTNSC